MSQLQFNLVPERKIWSVSELTAQIRILVETRFQELLVQGEISNCRAAQSGVSNVGAPPTRQARVMTCIEQTTLSELADANRLPTGPRFQH